MYVTLENVRQSCGVMGFSTLLCLLRAKACNFIWHQMFHSLRRVSCTNMLFVFTGFFLKAKDGYYRWHNWGVNGNSLLFNRFLWWYSTVYAAGVENVSNCGTMNGPRKFWDSQKIFPAPICKIFQVKLHMGFNVTIFCLVCGKCLELLCFAVIGQFYEYSEIDKETWTRKWTCNTCVYL